MIKMRYFVGVALLFAVCNGQAIVEVNDNMCETRNGYYKADNSCDAYYECRDYVATKRFCPDGLNYNPDAEWPNYPCSYPVDIPCNGRVSSQPPQPTDECPRQYGFFKSPLATADDDCSRYRLCAEGRAYDMFCPYGLGFDLVSGRCDWPERIPGCNFEAYLGFTCPPPHYEEEGYGHVSNYKYEGDCYMFFSCQNGRARLLSCDPGYAFDPVSGICIDADLISCESSTTDNINDSEEYVSTEPTEY